MTTEALARNRRAAALVETIEGLESVLNAASQNFVGQMRLRLIRGLPCSEDQIEWLERCKELCFSA